MPPTRPIELTAADASLLREEQGAAHMHVGGVAIFAGPPPPIHELRAHVLGRLERVPRYRTTLVLPPLGVGRPRWAVDPRFHLDYHVRHTALPAPGDERELRVAVARLFSQRLDRTKPLWELWVIEGLSDGRFALVFKAHQALVDGVVSLDLMTELLDADPARNAPAPHVGWLAPPLPSSAQMVAASLTDLGRTVVQAPLRLARTLSRPAEALERVQEVVDGGNARLSLRLKPAPPSPLNVPIGPHRCLSRAAVPVAELKRIKDRLGGSVNDVVLVLVAGAIRHWMHERGLETSGLELRAAVPVAIEARGREARPIAMTYAPLPVDQPDPLLRLERVRRSMSPKLRARHAVDAATLTATEEFAPPSVLAQASRLHFDARRFNVLVANVPGPQTPMYLLGRRMETTVPLPFLAGDRALAIAVTSYAGTAEFGLLGDLDVLPDVDLLADGLQLAVDELRARADGQPPVAA